MAAKIYNVGSEDIGSYSLECFEKDGWRWFAYWYESGDYCGSGEGVALDDDGNLWESNLGHCSCYGPGDGLPGQRTTAHRLLVRSPSALDAEMKAALRDKVAELLGIQAAME